MSIESTCETNQRDRGCRERTEDWAALLSEEQRRGVDTDIYIVYFVLR